MSFTSPTVSPEIGMLLAGDGQLVWLGWDGDMKIYDGRADYLSSVGVALASCQIRYSPVGRRHPECNSIVYLLGRKKILEHQWRCLIVL